VTQDPDLVLDEGVAELPFSKGLMAQSLMAAGLSPEKAYALASALQRALRRTGRSSPSRDELRALAREQLGEEAGEDLVRRLAQWRCLRTLQRPLIILIGGTTGVGKSTLATQVAHRLGIVRVASSDTVRQVMRAFFAPELMPAIHYSSFAAADAVRVPLASGTDRTRIGFTEQAAGVAVGIQALVARAIEEAQSVVVEGVHLVPGILDESGWGEAIVLQYVVAVRDAATHRGHFTLRDWQTGGVRPLERYVEQLPRIRRIQKYILACAAEHDVKVIDNQDIDAAVREVVDDVLRAVGAVEAPPGCDRQGGA
jgi:2-phosphoglycerate kinase